MHRRNFAVLKIRHLLFACAALAACAQAYSPTGGEPDQEPPRVVETYPAQGAVLSNFSGKVRIKFDETLSERGVREDDAVSVSPATGKVSIDRSGWVGIAPPK